MRFTRKAGDIVSKFPENLEQMLPLDPLETGKYCEIICRVVYTHQLHQWQRNISTKVSINSKPKERFRINRKIPRLPWYYM